MQKLVFKNVSLECRSLTVLAMKLHLNVFVLAEILVMLSCMAPLLFLKHDRSYHDDFIFNDLLKSCCRTLKQ